MSNSNTPAEPPVLSENEARALTEVIKAALDTTWQLIAEAYHKRADRALGYESWDAYVLAEFGSCALRVPREDRPEMVRSLRSREMSLRAIATALGISERTVRRDLDQATAANAAVAEQPIATVVGLDGRRQPASRREQFWRRPPEPPPAPRPVELDDPPPPRPPVDRDLSWNFVISAGSLKWKATELAGLHKRVRSNPNKRVADGVAKVRQAVEILQAILADDVENFSV